MKRSIVLISIVGLIVISISLYLSKQSGKNDFILNFAGTSLGFEEKQVLKIAKDTAIKVYGYDLIEGEFPLFAELQNDTTWLIKGTLGKGLKGGTVCVEMSRGSMRVRKIIHYR